MCLVAPLEALCHPGDRPTDGLPRLVPSSPPTGERCHAGPIAGLSPALYRALPRWWYRRPTSLLALFCHSRGLCAILAWLPPAPFYPVHDVHPTASHEVQCMSASPEQCVERHRMGHGTRWR
jgi:hypothetical protein